MENIRIENFKDIKIEDKTLRVFERFPNFIPFVGEECGNNKHTKLLLIWESYYDTKKPVREIVKCTNKWYFDAQIDEIHQLFGKETHDYKRPWNFASKMHKEGIYRKRPTFKNVEKVLDKFTNGKNSFKYCAGYNYYLRPATNSSSIKSDITDDIVAIETLKNIIQELKPNFVIFFSKKANASFKSDRSKFENVRFNAFVHPASAWWNRKSGKEQKTGKERFEEFVRRIS